MPVFRPIFLGACTADFEAYFRQHMEVIGMRIGHTDPNNPGWALRGNTWEDYQGAEVYGMIFELFKAQLPPPADRAWGHGQSIRPSIQVSDVEKTVANLRERGVDLGEVERAPWGWLVEMITPEGVRWPGKTSRPMKIGEARTSFLPTLTATRSRCGKFASSAKKRKAMK